MLGGLFGVFLLACVPSDGAAQADLAIRDVGLGVRIGLPASWIVTDAEELLSVPVSPLPRTDASTLEVLQGMTEAGESGLLFRARDPYVPANTASMRATVGRAMTSIAFVRPADAEEVADSLCETFAQEAERFGGTGGCLEHRTELLEGRAALVLEQEAVVPGSAINIVRTVALIPLDGVLLALEVSLDHRSFDPSMVSAILASIRVPPLP